MSGRVSLSLEAIARRSNFGGARLLGKLSDMPILTDFLEDENIAGQDDGKNVRIRGSF